MLASILPRFVSKPPRSALDCVAALAVPGAGGAARLRLSHDRLTLGDLVGLRLTGDRETRSPKWALSRK